MESPFLQADGLLKYIGVFLSGVCHQFLEHSFVVGGKQIPLCARCSGTYLGALLGIGNLWLRGRTRASRLPPARVLAILGLLFASWGIDGLNSYFQFLTGRAGLYPPSNFLRLTTGMGNGLSLSLLVFPMFNSVLWREPDRQHAVHSLTELGALLLQAVGLALLIQTAISSLFYPLLLADTVSVLLMLTLVNSMIVVVLLHRENSAVQRRQTLLPLGLGLLLAIVEVGGIASLRYWLGSALLLPMLPASSSLL